MNDSHDDIFKYPDTNSSRADIDFLNRKFKRLKIAIIGMGGTGAYILDLVSKTWVSEIHIYDGDILQLHNVFRMPGTVSSEKLDASDNLKKVDHYFQVYSQMHNGIVAHDRYVTDANIHEFKGFDFVFIAVDKNKVRHGIVTGLQNLNVAFIDCGMGVQKIDDALLGTIRITTGSLDKNDHLINRIGSDEFDDNEYATNIQIAELNALNATLAVIKWKRYVGFYQDLKREHNTLYFLNTGKTINEDNSAQVCKVHS
jgi:hypothetical protein